MKGKSSPLWLVVLLVVVLGLGALGGCVASNLNHPDATPAPVDTVPPFIPGLITPTPEPVVTPEPPDGTGGGGDQEAVTLEELALVDTGIPAPRYFSCISGAGTDCVSVYTPYVQAITHVVFLSGGNVDLQAGADILQALDNQMRMVWNCKLEGGCTHLWEGINPDSIAYSEMTREQRAALAVFVLSDPYDMDIAPEWTAWEWGFPTAAVDRNPPIEDMWKAEQSAVDNWLSSAPGTISIRIYSNIILPNPNIFGRSLNHVTLSIGSRIHDLEDLEGIHIYRTNVNGTTYNFYYTKVR